MPAFFLSDYSAYPDILHYIVIEHNPKYHNGDLSFSDYPYIAIFCNSRN